MTQPIPGPKQQFLGELEREHARTMRVLRAYPDDKSDFKPHERSRSAREIAWPIVLGEERLMMKALTTGFDWSQPPGAPPKAPATMSGVTQALEKSHPHLVNTLSDLDESRLGGTVKFFVAPKTLGDVPLLEFLRFILFDQIHHRGQLSVYLKMVGNVPAIYGPSGDEPWT